MKTRVWSYLFAFLFCLGGSFANAELDSSFLSANAVVLEKNFAIVSADCKKVFYVPRTYSIDSLRSSILLSSKIDLTGKKTPIIQMTIFLVPENDSLKVQNQSEFTAVTTQTCPGANLEHVPYPAFFQSFTLDGVFNDIEWPNVEASVQSDGSKVIRLDVDPLKMSLPALLYKLKYFQPEASVQFFNLTTDASVSLSVDYQVAANFAENHFTERSCTLTRKCHSVFGFGHCDDEESCEDIPKIVQVLTSAQHNSGFTFVVSQASDVSEEKIYALEGEVLSRLMMSLFLETSRTATDDVVRIKYGELRKDRSGQYQTQANLTQIDENSLTGAIQIPPLDAFAAPDLTEIYQQLSHRATMAQRKQK